MTYTVTAPLVIIPNADGTTGDGYFYQDAVIPDGFNDERCKELVEEKMLEKAATADSSGSDSKPDTIKAILADVGDDKDKAAAALEQEKAGQNRPTLVEKLEAIANPS